MQHETEEISARFDATFGPRWRAEYARALGVSRETVSRMREPTLKSAAALIELLESTHPENWPARWAGMRDLYYRQRVHAQKGT